MNNQINDTDLDIVSGGAPLSCEGSHLMSVVYTALSSVHFAMGDTAGGYSYGGQAIGVRQGSGCPIK